MTPPMRRAYSKPLFATPTLLSSLSMSLCMARLPKSLTWTISLSLSGKPKCAAKALTSRLSRIAAWWGAASKRLTFLQSKVLAPKSLTFAQSVLWTVILLLRASRKRTAWSAPKKAGAKAASALKSLRALWSKLSIIWTPRLSVSSKSTYRFPTPRIWKP